MENTTGIFLALIFVTAVKCQDFNFTCPSLWKDKEEQTLTCALPRVKFNSKTNGGLCDIYEDNVLFLQIDAGGSKSLVCQVSKIYTLCNGTFNSEGCGCEKISGGVIFVSYKIIASEPDEKGARWECLPQCYDASFKTRILTPPNTTACFKTQFFSKCSKNGQCKRGTCRFNENDDDICDCTGTLYAGTRCEKLDPFLVALICVSTLLGVVMTAVGAGVYSARKQKSGGQQNAPPADAPLANAPQVNDPRYSVPQVNDPRYNTPLDNAPQVNYSIPPNSAPQVNYSTPPHNALPDNDPQVAGSAGPSTGQTVPTTPDDESYESSVAGSEASEGTEYSASEVSEV